MEDKLNKIIRRIKPWSDELDDTHLYVGQKWVEVDLTGNETQSIIHIFNDEGAYLLSLNGNIAKGFWQNIDNNKSLVIENYKPNSDTSINSLYDLLFLNSHFFILKKNGKDLPFAEKYLFLIQDNWEEPLDFEEALDELNQIQKSNTMFFIGVIGLALIAILYFIFK